MANVKKEMMQLRKRFHKTVLASGGEVKARNLNSSGKRYDYIVGDVKQYYIWHGTVSDVNGPKNTLKDIRRIAEILSLCREARKMNEIELISRVHDSAEWEAYEDYAEVWLKDITAKLQAEVQGKSSD